MTLCTPPVIDLRARHWSKIEIFASLRRNIAIGCNMEHLEWWVYQMMKKFENVFTRCDAVHERDGQADKCTDTA